MKNPVKIVMVNKAYYNIAENLSRPSVSLINLFCFEKMSQLCYCSICSYILSWATSRLKHLLPKVQRPKLHSYFHIKPQNHSLMCMELERVMVWITFTHSSLHTVFLVQPKPRKSFIINILIPFHVHSWDPSFYFGQINFWHNSVCQEELNLKFVFS